MRAHTTYYFFVNLLLLFIWGELPAFSQGAFGVTREALDASFKSANDANGNPVTVPVRPSDRFGKEITPDIHFLIRTGESALGSYRHQPINVLKAPEASCAGSFEIPARGNYRLELTIGNPNAIPASFDIAIDNQKYTYQLPVRKRAGLFFSYTVQRNIPVKEGNLTVTVTRTGNEEKKGVIFISAMRLIPEFFPDTCVTMYPEASWQEENGPRYLFTDNTATLGKFKGKGIGVTWEVDIPASSLYAVEVDYKSSLSSSKPFSFQLKNKPLILWEAEPTSGKYITKTVGVVNMDKGTCNGTLSPESDASPSEPSDNPAILLIKLRPISEQEASILRRVLPENTSITKSSPSIAKKEEEDFGISAFPELSEPPVKNGEISILQEFTKNYEMRTKNLKDKYVASLKKLQQKYVQNQDFSAVAAIQELISNPDNLISSPTKDISEAQTSSNTSVPTDKQDSATTATPKKEVVFTMSDTSFLGRWKSTTQDTVYTFWTQKRVKCVENGKRSKKAKSYYRYGSYLSILSDEGYTTTRVYQTDKDTLNIEGKEFKRLKGEE